jgi:hypothetical protein
VIVEQQRQIEYLFDKHSFSKSERRSIENPLTDLYGWHLPTYIHSVNVALIADEAAKSSDYPPKIAVSIALKHDFGKLGVSKDTLNSTTLTEKQREEMNDHAMMGYEMLKSMANSLEDYIDAESVLMIHGFQENYYPFDARHPSVLNRLGKKFSDRDAKTIYLGTAGVSVCDFSEAASHRKDDYFGKGTDYTAISSPRALLSTLEEYRPATAPLARLLYKKGLLGQNCLGSSDVVHIYTPQPSRFKSFPIAL